MILSKNEGVVWVKVRGFDFKVGALLMITIVATFL